MALNVVLNFKFTKCITQSKNIRRYKYLFIFFLSYDKFYEIFL